MYIPVELVCFVLGFICFPVVCYAVMEIKLNLRKDKKSNGRDN